MSGPAKVELVGSERAPLLARPYYRDGDPGPIVAALANVPELMEVALPFVAAVFGPGQIEPRWKEMVVLHTSAVNRCRHCTETHTAIARRMGFQPDELAALRGEAPAPAAWGPVERALLEFARALSEAPQRAVQVLRAHFGDPEIVELVALASATVMLNRFASALGLPA